MEDAYESEYKPLSMEYLHEVQRNKELAIKRKAEASKSAKERAEGTTDSQGDEIAPDITLADGEVLPQYYGKCPEHLLGQPIEDLDPYYKEKGEPTFCVATERFSNVYLYRFTAANACFLLSPFNPVRRLAVRICVNQFFDYIVMLTIIVNCVFLALDNEVVESEYAFTAIYTLEMIIKLLARGFILRPFTYLRDWWNWLDFVVVALAWVTIIIDASSGPSNLNLSGLRTFRVIRAFKSFTIVPGLKTIVNALLQSLKPLAEVMVIMLFLVVVISLIALQAYQGVLRRKCVRYSQEHFQLPAAEFNAYITNQDNWNPVSGELEVCGNASSSGLCPDGYICMQDVGGNPNHGYTNFDHFGWAMLTSFQLLTLDFWENVYNMIIRAEGAWNVLFFFMCVVLGPFYLLNLLLAVVTLAYSKEHEKQTKLREMRERAKENARRRNKRRRLLMERSRQRDFYGDDNTLRHQTKEKNGNGLIVSPLPNGDALSGRNKSSSQSNLVKSQRSVSTEATDVNAIGSISADENRRRFHSMRKDMSLDSSESANSNSPEWKTWIKKKYRSFHGTCCSWSCHPKFVKFQDVLLKVVEHKLFSGLVALSIITNTVFLALDHHAIDATFDYVLVIGNYVFTGIFALEALLKILAMGCLNYAKDPWNVFDFSIVVISLLEFGLPSSTGALSVLRSLRLMRVFRLARIWTTMRKLMSIILKSLSAVVYLTIVLFMVLFIFAVVGKQLFGKQYEMSADKFDDHQIPRWNFKDFYHSFLLVWRVMCGEWIEPLHDCMLITESPEACIPVFLLMTFIGNFLVLNLFTAILLEAFNVDNLKSKQVDQKTAKLKSGVERFRKLLKKSQNKSRLEQTQESTEVQEPPSTAAVETSEPERDSIEKTDEELRDAYSKKPRSMSIANIFALNQASGKRRATMEEDIIEEESTEQASDDIVSHVDEIKDTPFAAPSRSARRRTLTKQSRISDDEISTTEEIAATTSQQEKQQLPTVSHQDVESEVNENQSNDTDQAQLSASKKVTFAVSAKSKVHPRNRNSVDHNVEGGNDTKVKKGLSWCYKCCVPYKPEDESEEITSVIATGDQEAGLEITEEQEERNKKEKPPRCFPKCCTCCHFNKESAKWELWRKFRSLVFRFVIHRVFEWFILVVILASTVSLALEDVHLKDDPARKQVLDILEYIFTIIFTIEMILKWIGIGWTKYFTNWWCIIDFVIVVISWIGIGASAVGQVESLKALRTLRALRPLRAISRWQGMRVVVNALVYCIPSIANVLCVCLLLWLVFSIIGVQQFKGKFYRCEDADGNVINYTIVPNETVCNTGNYTWTTPRINFDNVLNGMIALFQVATFEGWIEIMRDASDTVSVGEQPRREANVYSYIFFFCFVLIGSFFILNLIVGVIIESFQKLRKQTESSSAVEAFLTESQKNFYKTMRTMLNRKPKKTIPPPENEWQLRVFKIVTHGKFEVIVFSVIVLNMVTLAMEHYQMTETWKTVLRYVDISFTALFTIEAFMKIFGTRFYYFRDPFNVFDFVVVLLSITGFILEELLTFLVSPTLLRVVRVFRVFRVLRVIRAARGIRRLILTLMISLPALFNIAVLLGVFMVIFAILGMSFFMDVKLRGALNDIVNFRTFGNSMMLLFRLMTSAGWNDVLDPLMNDSDCDGDECGKYHIAIIYFVSYIFLVFLVVVNMYIAIILENFDEIFQQEESGVGQDDFEFFYVVWGRYDPKASQFVSIAELSNLLHSLHPPFQLAKPNEIKIAALNLPIVNGDKVHCLDVLFALVKRIMGEVEISDQMRQEAEARLLKSFPNRKSLKAETTTLALRQRVKAAKIIQDAWRGFHVKRKRGTDSSSNELFSMSSLEGDVLSLQSTSKFVRLESTEEGNKEREDNSTKSNGKVLPQPRLHSVQENTEDELHVDEIKEIDETMQSTPKLNDLKTSQSDSKLTSNTNATVTNIQESSKPKSARQNAGISKTFPKSRTFSAFERQKSNSLPQRKRSGGEESTITVNKKDLVIENTYTVDAPDTPTAWPESKSPDSAVENGRAGAVTTDSNSTVEATQKVNVIPEATNELAKSNQPTEIYNSKSKEVEKQKTEKLNGSEKNVNATAANNQTKTTQNSKLTPTLAIVKGKDLKLNPRTGQFKTKGRNSEEASKENAIEPTKEIDQSTVIVNSNASTTQKT